jgi:hypothetical protein
MDNLGRISQTHPALYILCPWLTQAQFTILQGWARWICHGFPPFDDEVMDQM